MINLPQIPVHIIATFILDGVNYEIEHFHIDFKQPTDYKNQPQSELRGGQLIIEILQIADDNLYEWARNAVRRKDCTVIFENEMVGTVLRIEIANAYCAKLTRTVDAFSGTQTTLVIAPESVILNGLEHLNFWPN